MDLVTLVRLALEEDVGPGDLTTEACVPAGRVGAGRILAKQALVVCGHAPAAETFRQLGATYVPLVAEGEDATPGTPVAQVTGPLRALLTGERVALNFLMKLSGIATHTRGVVAAAAGLRVVDTRKTSPLLRRLERRAVQTGGGANHRFALYDGILIKDNHILAAGGIRAAVARARAAAHPLLKVEVEVETEAEADEAAACGADVLLLDNMDDATMARIAARHGSRCVLEASGNLDAARLPGVAASGVHYASMGGLIHQARWADLSMRLDPPAAE
jgi:nicotinate-nucleotide pyrophosphorylase (carboxylating)